MWAIRRRLRIIGIIVASILLFVIVPYWLSHREIPSCFDGKQNQKETGIDCGGSCTLLCKGAAKDLSIIWTKVFPIRPGEYDVVAYVENPNFNISAPAYTYTATLYDANGNEIAKKDSDGFALPSERFVLFAGRMLTGDIQAVKGSIEIHPDFSWITSEKSPVLFSVTDKVLTGADQKPKLTAIIRNLTSDTYRNIDISAIIYDSKSNPIGVSSTRVEKLDPNGSENLIFTWPAPFDYVAEAEACEAPVDVILALDRSGSMRDEDKIGQAKAAAMEFVGRLSNKDQAGYVSFANTASNPIDQSLISDTERLKRVIAKTDIHTDGLQFTNIGDALRRAIDEFATLRHDKDSRPIIVLLTDGIPNRPADPLGKKNDEYASQYALQVANEVKNDEISLYTIGLGSDVNSTLLQSVATKPEQYYQAASGAELTKVYQQIATSICKKNPSIIEIIPRINNATPSTPTR